MSPWRTQAAQSCKMLAGEWVYGMTDDSSVDKKDFYIISPAS
jgi:hypothetical protein